MSGVGGGSTVSAGSLAVSGGKFTGASGTITDGGDLTISGTGKFTASSSTTTVAGSFTFGGTSFTANAGTVVLTGSSLTLTGGTSTNAFYALSISGSYTLGGDLATTSDLTLTGTLSTNGNAVSVGGNLNQSSGTFTGGAGTVGITGNLSMTGGTYTGGAGSATVGGNVDVSATVTNGGDPTLVGYWTFDDTPNHTADSSANGNTLTWTGTPTYPSTSLPPVSFSDSYDVSFTGTQSGATSVLSGSPELTPATVTVSAWYKAKSIDTTAAEIVSGSNTYGLRVTSTGLTVMKRIACNSTPTADWIEYRVPFSGVLDGNWHEIVGVIVTGTGGSMTAYLDGVVATGAYWVNGTGGAQQLSASTTPTSAAAAASAIDWVTGTCSTESYGLVIGNNPSTTGYQLRRGHGVRDGRDLRDRRRAHLQPRADSRRCRRALARQPAGQLRGRARRWPGR